MNIILIVGLGNPGNDYDHTRHNAGAWWVEDIAKQYNISLAFDKKLNGMHAPLKIGQHACHLHIPSTFMNHSGRAVRAISQFYKIPPQAILIAHDDLDLSPGTVRLKKDGGHGGHNGLRDIIEQLGTTEFYRLRVGIGHPGHREQVLNYVLGRPSVADNQQIHQALANATLQLDDILSGNIQNAMNKLHVRSDTK